jgi:hypothetical protein
MHTPSLACAAPAPSSTKGLASRTNQRGNVVGRQRSRDVIALGVIASFIRQRIGHGCRLDSLGYHRQIEGAIPRIASTVTAKRLPQKAGHAQAALTADPESGIEHPIGGAADEEDRRREAYDAR